MSSAMISAQNEIGHSPEWEILTIRGVEWSRVENLQRDLVLEIQANPMRRYSLVCEPNSVFTAGVSAKPEERLWNREECLLHGVDVTTVNRGGKWTYHGPGQIVLFPLVDLSALGLARRDTKRFVDLLEQSVVRFLANLGITAETYEECTGVFVDRRKICAIGIRIVEGICTHGISIYLEPQERFFAGIQACGVPQQRFTSLRELGVVDEWESLALDLSIQIENSFKSLKT